MTLSQKVLPQPFRIIFNRSRRLIVQIVYRRPISAVNSTPRDSEGVHKDLNVIVALMSKCVCVVCLCERGRKTQREGEVRCVFQVWCHIMCLSGTVCVPGLPALFIPDSFVLVPGLTLCDTLHMLLAHQNHSYTCPGYEVTNVFIHQNGNRLVCCFRKQYAIDSFLEQLIYQGSTT